MNGRYIYGIIRTEENTSLKLVGLGGSNPVHIASRGGLGCVFSDYSGKEFTSMRKEELVRSLLAHQVVVERVMREHTVLPVKFGTVLATSDEVHDLLCQGHRQFVDALVWIQDKLEVEVAATWDTGQVLREISGEEGILHARETLARNGQPPSLEERVRLGQMVKASMDRRRDSYRERMMDFLKPAAHDVQPNALVSDEMVMNVAFLVEKARQEEFDNLIHQMNEQFRSKIDFRIIGPLPPYSFATVGVARLNPDRIKEARELFCLGEVISEAEVRKAYRRLASETHPDRNPGDELARKLFAELRLAADLLISYSRCQAESGGGFLIDIRRMGGEEIPHLRFAEIGV